MVQLPERLGGGGGGAGGAGAGELEGGAASPPSWWLSATAAAAVISSLAWRRRSFALPAWPPSWSSFARCAELMKLKASMMDCWAEARLPWAWGSTVATGTWPAARGAIMVGRAGRVKSFIGNFIFVLPRSGF